MTRSPGRNVFEGLADAARMREAVVELILATDLSKQVLARLVEDLLSFDCEVFFFLEYLRFSGKSFEMLKSIASPK